MTYIHAFDSIRSFELAPDAKYSVTIIRELYSSGLIIVNPNSDLDRIELSDHGNYSFYMNEVEFLLPHPNPSGFITEIEDIIITPAFHEENKAELELFAKCVFASKSNTSSNTHQGKRHSLF
jgi:hypothetical protein